MKGNRKRTLTSWKLVTTFVVVLAMAVVYGCGGGGGGGGTNPQTDFPLYQLGFDVDPGFAASFTGSGTITAGGTPYDVTGSYNIQVLDDFYLEDYATWATPVETLLNITVTETSETLSILTTTYINVPSAQNTDVVPIIQVIETDNDTLTLTPTAYYPLPEFGKLGDSGEVTSWLYDNGDTISGTWALKSAESGFINLEINYDQKNSQEDFIGVETDTFKINDEGTIVSVKVISHDFEDDIIIEFSATNDSRN